MRIILDTNILVSALRSATGASYKLVSQLPSERFEIALTVPLYMEYQDVLSRAELFGHHHVQMEPLSVRERMTSIIDQLRKNPYCEFQLLFAPEEGRMGVVVTFLAIMELTREKIVDIIQNEPFGQIYVKSPDQAAQVYE